MAGNSQRRGAIRKTSKKPRTVGSGGIRRRGLEGKGPTPKAEDRVAHVASRRGAPATKAAGRTGGRAPSGSRRSGSRGDAPEVIAGRNSVLEALRAEIPVKTLYVASRIDSDDRVKEAIKLAADRDLPMLETPRVELDRITDGAVHQGLALQIPPYDYAHPNDLLDSAFERDEPALVVALDSVTDPRNLGAVVRSAAAFGAHGVLVPERRSAGMTAGAWKTSAGAASRLPVARTTNLARQLREYAKAGVFVVGLSADGDTDIGDLTLADAPLAIVVGSEGKGLSRVVAEACDQLVRIPIASEVESLNAGVAASVALYAVAQRRAAAS